MKFSGRDTNGEPGSPLVLLDKGRGKEQYYCSNTRKDITFIFNESIASKSEELSSNLKSYIKECEKQSGCGNCAYKYQVRNSSFKDIFADQAILNIFQNKKYGKFVLLDQYGFSQIDEEVFRQLVSFPKTDFIFFISSSFISRFREHQNTTKYIDTSKISFDKIKPNEIHRAVADYFRDLIPSDKEYYLHHFSIQKEANKGNYYGLIFGSNHTLGMEKFLKVCWKYDMLSGEANHNIDGDFEEDELFYDPQNTNKKREIRSLIKENILARKICDNITGLKFTMKNGCEPKLFTEVVQELEKANLIERTGDVNNTSSNIHNAKIYNIRVTTNEQA